MVSQGTRIDRDQRKVPLGCIEVDDLVQMPCCDDQMKNENHEAEETRKGWGHKFG
jgi:hypothetical protein